jgi:hypothetical protein
MQDLGFPETTPRMNGDQKWTMLAHLLRNPALFAAAQADAPPRPHGGPAEASPRRPTPASLAETIRTWEGEVARSAAPAPPTGAPSPHPARPEQPGPQPGPDHTPAADPDGGEAAEHGLPDVRPEAALACAAPPPAAVRPPAAAPAGPPGLTAALNYLRLGFSIVPQLPGKKHPRVKWKQFQERPPTEEEVRCWFRRWPPAGVAVVLGAVSGLFAIDVDGEQADAALRERLGGEPAAPKVLSGSGKPCRYHLFFRAPGLPTRAKITPWHPNLEFRGDRGVIVLPPSLHMSGNCYAWAAGRSLDDLPLPELPAPVLEALAERAARDGRAAAKATARRPAVPAAGLAGLQQRALESLAAAGKAVAGQGGDAKTYRAACRLVHGFGLSPEQALPVLKEWNRTHCEPPWEEAELVRKLGRAAADPRGRAAGPPPGGGEAEADAGPQDPVLEHVRDLGMIDPDQPGLFDAVAETRGLFAGVAGWPTYAEVLGRQGAGARAAADALRAAAAGPGGVLWTDANGNDWAVRLVPASGDDPDAFYALGVSRRSVARWLRPGPNHKPWYFFAEDGRGVAPPPADPADARRAMPMTNPFMRPRFRAAKSGLFRPPPA